MDQIVAVPKGYYEYTHRVVGKLNDKGLENLSRDTNIPIKGLKNFRDTKKLDGWYMPTLYSNLFGKQTPLQVHCFLERELEGYVKFLNEDK